ncbi:MAG: NAD-dependent malic enzyme [Gloeobacteraceae cyanobacterium ES-bin-144]|nr:NAD-dependent malic enzyme [Verrucomicrobiales bacterium]
MNSTTAPSSGLHANGATAFPRGSALLANPLLNKGTAFSEAERDALGLRGLLPPRVFTLDEQLVRAYANFKRQPEDLDKYVFLTLLQNRNETLFYKLLETYPEEMIPIIYTPTVGQACLDYGVIFRRPRGMFISIRERGRIAEILRHWPHNDVRMIVVTDGERILGLGDLGVLGMGIPVGKLALYTSCAGLHPGYCLPITIDVGTNNESLHHNPTYLGLMQSRVRGEEYDAFMAEFVTAVKTVFPKALLQWEDFGNTNAFRLLHAYQKRICSFNDDIQGTAAVALAGVIAALRENGGSLIDQKILFLGAGEAGTGIADLFTAAAIDAGLSENDARERCWFVDSQGLVVHERLQTLAPHKTPYAHVHPKVETLAEAVEILRPTALIGVSGMPSKFTEEIIAKMADINERPIVFALSNPTSKAECTAETAYRASGGRAIFASGSPFPALELDGRTFVPGQGNNVYIFPGVGLGALVIESSEVSERMFLVAARTLAEIVTLDDLALGRIYPPLTNIRDVSVKIAVAVAKEAIHSGLAGLRLEDEEVEPCIRRCLYNPTYQDYV